MEGLPDGLQNVATTVLSCVRPSACRNANKQWLLGDSVLVSPVLTPHTNSLTAYFTQGSWYSAWDYSRMDMPQGGPVKLRVPAGDIAVHYRGGSIIPMQQYAVVTRDVRLSPVTLVIALPSTPSTGSVSGAGPVPPFALEQTCAAAHARNPGQLVSCGFLFMDGGEDINVSKDNSVQVRWARLLFYVCFCVSFSVLLYDPIWELIQ